MTGLNVNTPARPVAEGSRASVSNRRSSDDNGTPLPSSSDASNNQDAKDTASENEVGQRYPKSPLEQFSDTPTQLELLREQASNHDLLQRSLMFQTEAQEPPVSIESFAIVDDLETLDVSSSGDTQASERTAQIDDWLGEYALARDFLDDAGGERVSDAFNGRSSLGSLSPTEARYLAREALGIWQSNNKSENVREAAEGIESASTRRIVSEEFAQPSVLRFETAAHDGDTPAELSSTDNTALQTAIQLDATAVVNAHEGHQGALGSVLGDDESFSGLQLKQAVLDSVGDPSVDAQSDGISQMVTAIFLKSPSTDLINIRYRESMSEALASVLVDSDDFVALPQSALQNQLESVSARFDKVLASSGGRQLIADDNIQPALRGWAVTQIATDPAFNADNLQDGWDSDTVSQTFAAPVMEQYLARGTEPETLQGEALRNSIGQALGIAPDQLPGASETLEQQQVRLADGFDHQYYGPNARIDAIASRITELGGADAQVTIMPVVVTGNEFGAASFNVFKVDSDNGVPFIEDVDPTRSYEGFADWQDNSRLPPGTMTYAEGLDRNDGSLELTTENTALVTDTVGEWARKIGDGAALVVGVGVGVALVVGSGGTALLVAGAGAGLYTSARAGEQLYDAHEHGQDISDLSDSQVRSLWLDAAAGSMSFGAMGAARSASKLVSAGSRLAPAASNAAAGLQLSANVADLAAGGNQAVTLGADWDKLSNGERAMGLLNVAFWGGMTAASTHAGGASLADSYSFTRLRNNIEFGTPYSQVRNDDLQRGEIRVAYDTGENGRASNIRIEHGGGVVDSAMVDLHVQAARQIDASGGLRDRLTALLRSDEPPAIGSAGWEAELEITKIEGEQTLVRDALSQLSINSPDRSALQFRLDELDSAHNEQSARIGLLEELGVGFVASPTRGAEQASALDWPEAPTGYTWVAGQSEPHLRRLDPANSERLQFNELTRDFSNAAGVREIERVGHGNNEVTWTGSVSEGEIRVTGSLREFFRFAGRSLSELSAQSITRAMGLPSDQAGHILGHRFVLNEGLKNLFPQDGNFNVSAYKTLENEMADWISVGADVNVNIQLLDFVGGRPDTVVVEYDVTHSDADLSQFDKLQEFSNSANQVYNRTSLDDMKAAIASGQ